MPHTGSTSIVAIGAGEPFSGVMGAGTGLAAAALARYFSGSA